MTGIEADSAKGARRAEGGWEGIEMMSEREGAKEERWIFFFF